MKRRWILVLGVALGVLLGVSLTSLGCPGGTTPSRFLADVRLPELVFSSLPESAHGRVSVTTGGKPVITDVPGGKAGRVDVAVRLQMSRDEHVTWAARLRDKLGESLRTSGARIVTSDSTSWAELVQRAPVQGLESFDLGYRAGKAQGWIVVESVLENSGTATLTLHVREMPR
jgi:hypothetical protein